MMKFVTIPTKRWGLGELLRNGTLAKCTGARRRRSKEEGTLQRKNGLKLISKDLCIYQISTGFIRLMSSTSINERLLLCVSVFITG